MEKENLKKYVQEILENGHLISLASVDDHGPWVSDVIYTMDTDHNLYWVSRTESRHSKAFIHNPASAGSITTVDIPEGQGKGIQLEGRVTRVTSIPAEALAHYAKKRKGKNPWDLADGEAWYKFAPSKLDLIYEPLFGFTKKSITF